MSPPCLMRADALHDLDECSGVCRVLVDSQVKSNAYPYTPGALFLPLNNLERAFFLCPPKVRSQGPMAVQALTGHQSR